ncbi:MAG: hypothetical protein ACJ757_15250 [Gaiellaceae bacterium]
MSAAKPHEPGRWILIYIAYVLSDHADVARFVRKSSAERWRQCGFEEKASRLQGREYVPDYNTVELRFRGLEQGGLVSRRRQADRAGTQHEPRVGQGVHIDATNFSGPPRLHHCCTDDDASSDTKRAGAGR